MSGQALLDRIAGMARTVEHDEASIGVLSTGEQIAVALVLDRKDLLDRCGWGTMLAAVDRLGPQWLAACLIVQRQGSWGRPALARLLP